MGSGNIESLDREPVLSFDSAMATKRITTKPKTKNETKPKHVADRLHTGQVIELTVAGIDEEGFGLASYQGKKLLVSGPLPGEKVSVRLTHCGPRTMFAETVGIISPSPHRLATPPCGKAAFCDGCPLIAMDYQGQLAWKRTFVEQAIHSGSSLRNVPVREVTASPRPLHYRNSAKLVVSGTFRAPVIGIYRRNSHEVINIGGCPLHHPLINRVIAAVKEGISKGKVPVFNPRTGSGILRYLVVRVSERFERAMVIFVTARRSFNEIHHLAKHLRQAVPDVEVAVQNVNPSEGNVILGQHDHFLTREHAIIEEIGGVRFSISPRSFFQVNSGSARIIYEKVREWSALTGTERVVDLYCGIGGISLFLARDAAEVLGIEVVEAAVADAERNARLNGIENCTFEAGDAAELLEELREEGERIDLIVLNPPRKGCDRRVLETAAAVAPGRIIYVSCSPVTLARDLEILAGLGFRTREVQPVDMFPQTPHVENVALLIREKEPTREFRPEQPPKSPSRPPRIKKRGTA